nr:MCP four helix bundle domain-containing protein [Bacteroidota bacterium]
MKLNLRVKLIGSFGILLFLMVVVGLGGIYTSKVIQDRMDNIIEKGLKPANIMGDVSRRVGLVRANSLLHLQTTSIDDMNRYESEVADWIDKVNTNLNTLENLFENQATLDKLAEFRAAWEKYLRTWREQVLPLSRANRDEEAFFLARKTGAGGMAAREAMYRLDELNDANVAAANQRQKKANHDSMKSQYILSAVILLAIILGLAFGTRQGSRIAGSVNIVSKAVQKVAAGDFGQSVMVKTGDEIESMANSFNAMTGKLKTMVEELQSEITERKLVEEDLAKHRVNLEELVKHRTEELQQEIIERKQAEKALQKSEERLKAIFEASPDPIVVYDVNGHPLYLNPAFINIFEWTLKEVRGKRIPFVPEDQKEITRLKIRELYEYKNSVLFETKRLSKHGKQIDVLISAALIKGSKEINDGIIVNLRDITEQRKLENHLQQTQKMETIGTLAGGIAHDLNNILFPIMGHTELLLMDTPEDSPSIVNLNAIYTAALRAKDLVKQILTFSRQDSRELILMKMQPIIKEALKFIKSTIPKTIEIKNDINPDGGIIRADPTQIHQIIMNLVTNACHAMEETGGELRVGLKEIKIHKQDVLSQIMEPGVYACLTIADTGIGM